MQSGDAIYLYSKYLGVKPIPKFWKNSEDDLCSVPVLFLGLLKTNG